MLVDLRLQATPNKNMAVVWTIKPAPIVTAIWSSLVMVNTRKLQPVTLTDETVSAPLQLRYGKEDQSAFVFPNLGTIF